MYRIKLYRVEELRRGRTYIYLAELTGYTREYISNIMTGKRNLEENGLRKFLIPICEDSAKLKEILETESFETIVKYFFDIL